jgi:uncharacterized protein YegP (UPF0339 family)
MKKYLIAGLLVAGMVTPAFAASEFYVAQNSSNHKCEIVAKKPTGTTWTMLGSRGYPSKAAAQSALHGMSQCNS